MKNVFQRVKFQKQQDTGIIKYQGLPGIGLAYQSQFFFVFFLSTFNKDLVLAEHWVKHLANLFQSTLTRSLKTGTIFKVLFTSEETKHGGGGGWGVVWMGSTSHPGLLMGLNQDFIFGYA